LLHHILPERAFSEENQQVAMKRKSQLLFHLQLLFVVFRRFPTIAVTAA
jgi:hypothetical protein